MSVQTPSQALQNGRSLIREFAARHHKTNPRVFGSVLSGQDRPDSDLDLLVEPLPETTLFDLGGLQDALEEALGVRVDVNRHRSMRKAVGISPSVQMMPSGIPTMLSSSR